MDTDKWNQVSHDRLLAKRACEAAEGKPEYPALLKAFRALDHERERLVEDSRKERQAL